MRLDTKGESGESVLYKTPIVTDCGTFLYSCKTTEIVIVLGCTGRFGGNEILSMGPINMEAVGRYELRTITPLVGRMKTRPNPSGAAAKPYEWRQPQQQLACLHGHLVKVGHVDALMKSIYHIFWLLSSDEDVLMNIAMAGEIMKKAYGALRVKAEGIATAIGCGVRCGSLSLSRRGRRQREAPSREAPSRPPRRVPRPRDALRAHEDHGVWVS